MVGYDTAIRIPVSDREFADALAGAPGDRIPEPDGSSERGRIQVSLESGVNPSIASPMQTSA